MIEGMNMRPDGRSVDQLRPLSVSYDKYGYADASVMLELGGTKVLCAVTLTQGVPPFLKGSKTGWLKAEYAMLPAATTVRTQREACSGTRNGRSVEISRLIGRALRSMVNLELLGERTIHIDCDVLQADGGTRTACITAASLALSRAVERWKQQGMLHRSIITERIVGISVGVMQGKPLLDLNFEEDSMVDADFNLVLTESGTLIEVQGTAERCPVAWHSFEHVWQMALLGSKQIFAACDVDKLLVDQKAMPPKNSSASNHAHEQRAPIFSLQNRLSS